MSAKLRVEKRDGRWYIIAPVDIRWSRSFKYPREFAYPFMSWGSASRVAFRTAVR